MKLNRRKFIKTSAAVAAASTLPAPFIWPRGAQAQDVVKVGHSSFAHRHHRHRGSSVVDAEKLAIEEINNSGGVMGKKIEVIVEDGASDWPTFAEKARKLLEKDKVAAIFGCYTSASRKAVLPVMEQLQGPALLPDLLRRPRDVGQHHVHGAGGHAVGHRLAGLAVQEQGQELLPDRLGLHLAAHHEQDRQPAPQEDRRRRWSGESYYPLGSIEFASEINKIKAAKPDVIWSTRGGRQQRGVLQAAECRGHHRQEPGTVSRWRCPRKKRPGSARKTWKASCRAWATSRA